MKKILLILLMFITICGYSQIDYNIYIGNTKKEILQQLKDDGIKYEVVQKMYVDIDSTGKYFLDDNHYSYLVYYLNSRVLFTFNNKTDRCVRYYQLCENLENYWNYFDYYNQILTRIDSDKLTWIEKRHKFYVEIVLKPINGKQFQIFVRTRTYTKK